MAAWVYLDRNLTPTEAVKRLAEGLMRGGMTVLDLGVAKENKIPDLVCLASQEVGKRTISNFAQTRLQAQKAAAGHVRRFHDIPAGPENTFVLQVNGRETLLHAFSKAAKNTASRLMVLPYHHWSMYPDLAAKVRKPVIKTYGHPVSPVLGDDVREALEDLPFAVVTNKPNNPTGLICSPEWMAGLGAALDEVNSKNGIRINHIIDVANANAFPQKAGGEPGPWLMGNLAPVTKPDCMTPWSATIGFSKPLAISEALKFSRPQDTFGLTSIVVNPRYAGKFAAYLNDKGMLDGDPWLYALAAQIFDEGMDEQHLQHYGEAREKYVENFSYLNSVFPGQVVHGGPCATALLRLEDVAGCAVKCEGRPDGEMLVIQEPADVAEYIGNRHGVVVVPDKREGNALFIRVSQTQETGDFAAAINRLKDAIDEIHPYSGPVLSAKAGAPLHPGEVFIPQCRP